MTGLEEKTERSYRAFISYSHKDKIQVKGLQKRLETYRIPRKFRHHADTAEKHVYPVFRDDTDLTGVVLMDSIRKALDHSEFLIVICTPNSASSGYVNAEVDYFVQSGKADHIIPVVLHSQSPYELQTAACFPPRLIAAGIRPQEAVVYGRSGRRWAIYRLMYRLLGLKDGSQLEEYIDKRITRRFIGCVLAFPIIFSCCCL